MYKVIQILAIAKAKVGIETMALNYYYVRNDTSHWFPQLMAANTRARVAGSNRETLGSPIVL